MLLTVILAVLIQAYQVLSSPCPQTKVSRLINQLFSAQQRFLTATKSGEGKGCLGLAHLSLLLCPLLLSDSCCWNKLLLAFSLMDVSLGCLYVVSKALPSSDCTHWVFLCQAAPLYLPWVLEALTVAPDVLLWDFVSGQVPDVAQ